MAATRKPTKSESQMQREINMDRDMRDMVLRLTGIENSIRNIEARDAKIATLEFELTSQGKRITELENAKSAVIKIVMGSVAVALLATVVGTRLT